MKHLRRGNTFCLPKSEHIAWALRQGVSPVEAEQSYNDLLKCTTYLNDEYVVLVRPAPADMNPQDIRGLLWLSIRRQDRQPIRSWRDLQDIKNQILGTEAEAVELFPAESRKVDAVNQYHLFGSLSMRVPFGFGMQQREEAA